MHNSPKSRLPRAVLLFSALLAVACVAPSSSLARGSSVRVVKEAHNSHLRETVLTTLAGRTLYTLSAEKHGKFICTGSCLADWLPLLVTPGTKPTGANSLGTVKRPDGRTQVTFEGRPLYRFADDKRAGDAKGEGFKDVGTWHAASP
jgi:predicted lipoprotein with Yx(FWY)xxD motif